MFEKSKELKRLREKNAWLCRENTELHKAIEEALQDLNDVDCLNKSIVIMSASIRLEQVLKDIKKLP